MDYLTRCNCGRAIEGHYSDPALENRVRELCVTLGAMQQISVPSVGSWMVPRHYVALHGVTGRDVKILAELYGWPKAV